MALTWVWVGMVCVALIYGAATGQSAAVGAAAAQGVQQAVTFCLTVGGMICLWSGVMEVMRRSGIAAGLSRLLQPVLRRLFPRASRDAQTLDALSMNVSANLLGLGNAATPAGVRAAQAMARELRGSKASDELCLLVVLNTASIQLLPVTIAAVREAAGAAVPFDILPAVLALTVPALLAGVGLYGALTGTDVFSALTAGALDGLRTMVRIFPALVALLAAVSMLRASGALDALTRLCAPVLAWLGIPPETAILMVVRPVSGSGALAAASDIIGAYGPDSRIGRTAAVMLGSTETTFYVLAVYFGACGVRRSRWAIPAAIAADLTGFLVAAALVRWIWGA